MDELLEILVSLHPEVNFETETKLIDSKIFDSFDIITIISEIADTFDVVVPAKEIIPDNFNSAAALWDMICRLEDDE
ncbi:MAG: acyl carrier protein [Wujia sp.]